MGDIEDLRRVASFSSDPKLAVRLTEIADAVEALQSRLAAVEAERDRAWASLDILEQMGKDLASSTNAAAAARTEEQP